MNVFIFVAIGLTVLFLTILLVTYFKSKYYLRFVLTSMISIAYAVTLYAFPSLFLRLFISIVCLVAAIYQLLFEKRRS